MAKIQIYGDSNKGCIFFDGSTVEPKFLGTVISTVKADETDRIVIQRTDRVERDGVTFRKLFRRLKASRVQNQAGENLVDDLGYTVAEVAEYINQQASNYSAGGAVRPELDEHPNFVLDATQTTIMVDNGENFGVNTLKAVLGADGLIDILSADHSGNAIVHYEDCPHGNLQINGSFISGGPSDVVNALNELFTVGAFESVVISDPYATMVADVSGIDAGYTLEGVDAIDPIGDDIFTYDGAGYANYAGLKSTATIDQKGEYYTFDIRGEGTIGFGLVHSDASFAAGHYQGNVNYADPDNFAAINSAHYGMQFSHWFHPTPNGSWTNYGALTGYAGGSGWSNWDQQADWLAGNPVKIKCGIDENGYIAIYSLQNDSTWVLHARSNYPVPEGSEFHLGIKSQSTSARVYSAPKVHLLEPEAPTMYFRYIESPDGVYHYPLFATAEEAEYYDEIHNGLTAGTGRSHTHQYADDPTNSTWYMPEDSHDPTSYSYSVAPSNETFNGNAVAYTEVTSVANADLTPSAFSSADITQEEGTAVNIQVAPAGASWSSSVTITPSGSGLVYDGYSLVQGTLADVGADTVYTITVVRANSYGSTTGSMTVTATDVAPANTMLTPWTKALDFSGSSERAAMVTTSTAVNALRMGNNSSAVASNPDSNKTADSYNARPWATAIVFNADGHNSNQHVWNSGEGSGNHDDNIYLRLTASRQLIFGWGRGSDNNECLLHNSIPTNQWLGIYIAWKGGRFNSSASTATNLANAFDIRLTSQGDWNALSQKSTVANWITTGNSMLRSTTGDFTIGGRGSNRNFHGKVASMVCTSLMSDVDIPTDAEIKLMITDPVKWIADYKVGNSFRYAVNNSVGTFAIGQAASQYATQAWLMGDGTNDSYSNMIRNHVAPTDQNYTKLNLISMVSNDIQTVNINGLS